jgi:hypothetical protein
MIMAVSILAPVQEMKHQLQHRSSLLQTLSINPFKDPEFRRELQHLLVLDNAGWHGPANLKVPDGIRLIHLPPYSPELQPTETLWSVVDEPIVNKHIATIEELDAKIANQCVALVEQPGSDAWSANLMLRRWLSMTAVQRVH